MIADDESAKYILHLGLGETLTIQDGAGRQRKLKLVATLAGSIFQSEMLMSETNFLRLFPRAGRFSTVLVETTPADATRPSKQLLRETLNDVNDQEKSDYSATIETTAARLEAYHQVANTYLSTFRVLGSLGLMLGTIGLAVVLVRNLIERRPELALLAAHRLRPRHADATGAMGERVPAAPRTADRRGVARRASSERPDVRAYDQRAGPRRRAAAVLVVGLTSLVIAVRLRDAGSHPRRCGRSRERHARVVANAPSPA